MSKFYLIEEALRPCSLEDCITDKAQFAAVLTGREWASFGHRFDMGIDLEPDASEILNTKAEVNFDSLTGTFSIPDRKDITGDDFKFSFALDEKGIVFIDDSGSAEKYVEQISKNKKSRYPCLERFIFDFIETIVHNDLSALEHLERELDQLEDRILADEQEGILQRLNEVRGDMRDLRSHYTQLTELCEVLEENENGFFKEDNVRYFSLASGRVSRLDEKAAAMSNYAIALRDLYQSQLDVRQNHIMRILTVVTTIFMPLTLITGWYGMNFTYMPELKTRFGYPIVALVSLCIAIASLVFFKRKKWL